MNVKSLLFCFLLATTTALLGLMYFRPALRFNLLPPPPPEKKDEERSAKEQNDTKVRSWSRLLDR